ncbi:hypothetical protein [uncultured Chryseobacterium sp.]|uniref:hypothetical protein n=1 Tax=uncultured Chryseobacterium sp. TaxID=259322 RepID=UPI0025CC70C6|nr:hypothetical protein [uncultured Chryseobacterium sp.]
MKNSIVKILLMAGIVVVGSSFSDHGKASQRKNEISREPSKSKTYKIRYGLVGQTGHKTLSGSYDVGSFIATNTVTGQSYDTYYGGGFQTLPAYYDDLPAGNYTFTAMQGQGGWAGYGSVTYEVSDAQVDADGYVTIYIPIAWEE